jgi:hypothetical protein
MAHRYGEAALMATRRGSSTDIDPVSRWESAMKQLYPTSSAARRKSYPRGAFLGLCEEGLVKGIPAGHYTASKDDKAYARRNQPCQSDSHQAQRLARTSQKS